jgi:1,4-alpha-glucan branching enzyme
MSLEKAYAKNKKTCKVTFSLPKEATMNAKKVNLAGDFNKWDMNDAPMKKQKDNSFSVTVTLEAGREYQFRYCLNDGHHEWWENDWNADKYVGSPYGGENSVVIV